MRLKIATPKDDNFKTGAIARVYLDDADVSNYVSSVRITVDANEPITAEVKFYLTSIEVDVPMDAVKLPPAATAQEAAEIDEVDLQVFGGEPVTIQKKANRSGK